MFESIDVSNTNASKEWIIWHYQCFSDKWFKFQSFVFNGYHSLLIISIDINSIHSVDYRFIIVEITKAEAIHLLRNADLIDKNGTL